MTDNSNSTLPDSETPIVEEILDNDDTFLGYRCSQLLETNVASDRDWLFFLDLAYPPGGEQAAVVHVQTHLVNSVAQRFGVSTGLRCTDFPLNSDSWLVQFVSKPEDYRKVDNGELSLDGCSDLRLLFPPRFLTHSASIVPCRELEASDDQECFVYEAKVTGSLLGTEEMPDVEDFIEFLFQDTSFTSNSPFDTMFLSEQQPSEQPGDAGRDNLGAAANIKDITVPPKEEGANKITVIGGFLVALFCCAFVGIAFVLWRRRRNYLKAQDMHFELDKQYESQPTDESKEEPEEPQPTNNITIDLGTSFKDQLMGVHAGPPRRSQPMPAFPSSVASESDADSWAQTDGTIGSLELQLEPITAEV